MSAVVARVADAAANSPHLEVADAIGCSMVRDAIWHGDRCNWLAWNVRPDDAGRYVPILEAATPDLYAGSSGIALFLARLQALTGDPHQRRVARGALRQVMAASAEWNPAAGGFYAGPVGVGWSLILAGRAAEDESAVEGGLSLLERAARVRPAPQLFDLLNGRAGAVVGLVAAARAFAHDGFLAAAASLADEMVATGQATDEGLSWPSGLGGRNLLGLSHGTAGAALALFEVAAATGRADLRDAARSCLRYERTHFDAGRGAWPDFRTMPGEVSVAPSFPLAWCHGGIGVGLSRLRIRELDPVDGTAPAEIDRATSAVMARLAAGLFPHEDFSICHGVLGLGEFLVELAVRAGRPEALEAARRIGDLGASWFHAPRSPWPCGVPQAGETPGLMVGTAGIGLHYLRLHDPACAPGVALPTGDSLLDVSPRARSGPA